MQKDDYVLLNADNKEINIGMVAVTEQGVEFILVDGNPPMKSSEKGSVDLDNKNSKEQWEFPPDAFGWQWLPIKRIWECSKPHCHKTYNTEIQAAKCPHPKRNPRRKWICPVCQTANYMMMRICGNRCGFIRQPKKKPSTEI